MQQITLVITNSKIERKKTEIKKLNTILREKNIFWNIFFTS